jgi:hypothetical protein
MRSITQSKRLRNKHSRERAGKNDQQNGVLRNYDIDPSHVPVDEGYIANAPVELRTSTEISAYLN